MTPPSAYMIGDNDNNRWGTCLLPEFVAAYEAKTAGSYERRTTPP